MRKFLDEHFADKDYKDVYAKELSSDITKELDDIVQHIKTNY